jgi:hypothetical protein
LSLAKEFNSEDITFCDILSPPLLADFEFDMREEEVTELLAIFFP